MNGTNPTGDELLQALRALSHPQRLAIVAVLAEGGRDYVSRLARESGMSRPLLYMHLKRLEEAGLVSGELELSSDGKAMKYFELTSFDIRLTPKLLAEAARTVAEEQQDTDADGTTKGDN